jgi:hypothetical protein
VLHRRLVELESVVARAWRTDSAWIDDWGPENPARGQCGSTALVVQDYLGGTLRRGLVRNHPRDDRHAWIVHYWNQFGEQRIDLTWQQFAPAASVIRSVPAARAELLGAPWFRQRYAALRSRVDELLGQARAV